VVHEGEPLPVDVVAVRTDGTPTPQPVEAVVRLTRVDWQTNRVETAGYASEYRNEPRFEFVSQTAIKTLTPVKAGGKWTLAQEAKGPSITAGQPGLYLVEAVAKDTEGVRQVRNLLKVTAG